MSARRWVIVLTALLLAGCDRDPGQRARAYRASGDRYAQRGRDAAAVIEYRNAVKLSPSDGDVYTAMADALTRLGRVDDAALAREAGERTADGRPLPDDDAALRGVIAAHPRHVGARLALATRLLQRKTDSDLDEAETHLRAALAVEPGRELTNRALAALLLARDPATRPAVEEAETCLRRAAAAVPQRHRSRLALADYLFARRRWDDVARVLDEAARQPDLDNPVVLRRIALRDATGDARGARRELAERLRTQPAADAWALQAEFAWRDGDRDGALAAAREALTLDPSHAAAARLVEAARWQAVRPTASGAQR